MADRARWGGSNDLFSDADDGEAYVVTTSDGRLFRCHVDEIGAKREKRWVFTSATRVRYIGPAWSGPIQETEVLDLVEDWWKGMKRHSL
jgi:hypothetical protein